MSIGSHLTATGLFFKPVLFHSFRNLLCFTLECEDFGGFQDSAAALIGWGGQHIKLSSAERFVSSEDKSLWEHGSEERW